MPRIKTPTFEEFWKAYPEHKAVKEARRAWKRLRAADKVDAFRRIPEYIAECERTGVAFCYGPTYLNEERWTDEPSMPRGGTGGGTPTPPPAPDEMEIW